MDKRSALKLLIQESIILKQTIKQPLIDKIPSLSEDDVKKIGIFLAMEQKQLLENDEEIDTYLNQLLN